MPSPDVTELVDLTLYDPDPAALVARALALAEDRLPGWEPREHNIEVILLELLAEIATEWIYALNRLPGAVTEVLLRLFGLDRDPGAQAAGDTTFTLGANPAGLTIPAGARLRLSVSGDESLVTVDEDTVVAADTLTATVPVTVSSYASWPNSTATGTALQVIDPVPYLTGVVTDGALAGGRDPETTDEYLTRCRLRLRRLTDALVLPDHFTAAALEDPAVQRATVIDLYDGTGGPPYTDAGHLTVVARGIGGNLTSTQKADLQASLAARTIASLDVHVIDPTVTSVDVTVTVVRRSGTSATAVQTAIDTALRAYLNPATWPWSNVVRRNELIALIDGVADVDYVDSLAVPAADLTLPGDGPLAAAGTITITVN